jgi:hypothetical protein
MFVLAKRLMQMVVVCVDEAAYKIYDRRGSSKYCRRTSFPFCVPQTWDQAMSPAGGGRGGSTVFALFSSFFTKKVKKITEINRAQYFVIQLFNIARLLR